MQARFCELMRVCSILEESKLLLTPLEKHELIVSSEPLESKFAPVLSAVLGDSNVIHSTRR